MLMIKRNQKGFTLVELMIVVAIIGILAAMAVPAFGESSKTARGSKIAADLRTIDSAIQVAIAGGGTAQIGALNATDNKDTVDKLASIPTPPAGDYKGPKGTTGTVAATATYTIIAAGGTYRGALVTATADTL